MSDLEKRRIDRELDLFIMRNFEKPKNCKNLVQIRFYIQELSGKMMEFEARFNYIPKTASKLLSDYNAKQNSFVFENFKNAY